MSNMKNNFYKNYFALEIVMGLFSYIATSCQNRLLCLRNTLGSRKYSPWFPGFYSLLILSFSKLCCFLSVCSSLGRAELLKNNFFPHYSIYTSYICMSDLSESHIPWSNQDWIRLWWTRVFTKYYSMLIKYFTIFLVLICHEEWEFETFVFYPLLWGMKQDQIQDVSSGKGKSLVSENKKNLDTAQGQQCTKRSNK